MTQNAQIAVIGGGVAGLAAAARLGTAGWPVVVLEARDRIGGRIFTHHISDFDAPVELGAEFIHGLPPEIWDPLRQVGTAVSEVEGENWCAFDHRLTPCEVFPEVDAILNKMRDSGPDESFLTFIERHFPNPGHDRKLEEAKQRALAYITGFNAADPSLVGVHWLVRSMRAEEKIQGDRAFRFKNGYADILEAFRREIAGCNVTIRTETVVENIDWKSGSAALTIHNSDGTSILRASKVLVTLPLGVLKASVQQRDAVRFTPSLPLEKSVALNKLEMGDVVRVVLRFRRRFWERISDGKQSLADMNFLFSKDEWFPTWWTTMPNRVPLITAWAPFGPAQNLSQKNCAFVAKQALCSLSRLLGVSLRNLENWFEGAYFHDWQSDPYSRGAYSYGKVGADGAQRVLAAPLENTVFFAGEATDTSGHNGTVHGAIASGYRAAAEILKSQSLALAG